LPGAPPVSFNQYSGYITVNAAHGRQLFYWFVESQSSTAATDPLVLWLNGGPGCSSLGGFLSENGPFTVNPDGATLRLNPMAWNRIANVIYLESPAGVGFSFSKTNSDYNTGDVQTAQDSLVFLQQWLTQYPQYLNNPFWVTGESYGGHYVPDLAQTIWMANLAGQTPKINIQGFQVGNAWTNAAFDNAGAVFDWWSHALISDQTYQGVNKNCDFANIGPLTAAAAASTPNDLCDDFLNTANNDLAVINIYDIYADVCLNASSSMPMNQALQLIKQLSHSGSVTPYHKDFIDNFMRKHAEASSRATERIVSRRGVRKNLQDQMPDPDPCVDFHMQDYLNIAAVQAAIHAQPTQWVQCSNIVNYSYQDLLSSMIPIYEYLLVNTTLRMLVFSGDVDGIVPITGTRAWMATVPFGIEQPWSAWLDSEQQTGGYTIKYSYTGSSVGLTFASVRDAGHMVPWTQPGRSFDLFSRFLTGQP